MQNILIVGLGAIGAIYASIFYDKKLNLKILVDENRLERYKKEKTVINNREYDFEYILPNDNFKPDLILIAVKSDGFSWAKNNIKNFIGKDTIIMSLLNGITSEDELFELYPKANILHSFYIGVASVRNGRNITFRGYGNLVFGAIDKRFLPYQNSAQKLFDKCDINYVISPDIKFDMWRKLMLNVALNEVTAGYNLNYGALQESPKALNLCENLMKEVQALAKFEGVEITESAKQEGMNIVMKQVPSAETSMLQDVKAGRKTEVDAFAGEVIKRAEKYGLDVPYCREIYTLIKDKEKSFTQ